MIFLKMSFFGLVTVLVFAAADASQKHDSIFLWIAGLLPAVIGSMYFWELSDPEGYAKSKSAASKIKMISMALFAGLILLGVLSLFLI